LWWRSSRRPGPFEHLEEIASTPGLDVLFAGTSDLSFSLGYRGRQDEPRLEAAVEDIRAAAQRHGKAAGRPAATAAQARDFIERGIHRVPDGHGAGLSRIRGPAVPRTPPGGAGAACANPLLR